MASTARVRRIAHPQVVEELRVDVGDGAGGAGDHGVMGEGEHGAIAVDGRSLGVERDPGLDTNATSSATPEALAAAS